MLPWICFAADYINRNGQLKMMSYNGLVVLEVNDLPTYEKAVEVRNLAKKLPETMLCFLGGSGKSVKIVCRGELFDGGLSKDEKLILSFHQNLYNTARRAYQNQFGFDIEFLEPRLVTQRGQGGIALDVDCFDVSGSRHPQGCRFGNGLMIPFRL